MSLKLGFHPLVQRDLNEILDYYVLEAGLETADRFESEFRVAIANIQNNPRHYPFYYQQRRYRCCRLSTFPHLILYRETSDYLRVIVLKHVRRSPSFGLRRR
mgnify:CR=1 FL=1